MSKSTETGAKLEEAVGLALDRFQLELPTWIFVNSGTRFGQFTQAAAATTLAEKLADAGQVHRFTSICPKVSLAPQWDLPEGMGAATVRRLAAEQGVKPGTLNPILFQDQQFKFGSLANEQESVRGLAVDWIIEAIKLAKLLRSRDVSVWLADGSSFPGTADFRRRRRWIEEGLRQAHAALEVGQRLLLEYKPFEPASYHTDVADWGMALMLARAAGRRTQVLVDLGHHYAGQNIEQIVAWLLDEKLLGGFHLNDRRFADDDLTLGAIDPYQLFRVFAEVRHFEWETEAVADLSYILDQNHNLKDKIEETVQTVMIAQELYAKAAIVDFPALALARKQQRLIDAESVYRDAFSTDVRPAIRVWRRARGLAEDPLAAYRASGYKERIAHERAGRERAARTFA